MENEETPQELAALKRRFNVGAAIANPIKVKLDRERTIDFRSRYVEKMEQSLGLRLGHILKLFEASEWSEGDVLAILWAGLLKENPDMPYEIVSEIWDATPTEDRTTASIDIIFGIMKHQGLDIDLQTYHTLVEKYGKESKARRDEIMEEIKKLETAEATKKKKKE